MCLSSNCQQCWRQNPRPCSKCSWGPLSSAERASTRRSRWKHEDCSACPPFTTSPTSRPLLSLPMCLQPHHTLLREDFPSGYNHSHILQLLYNFFWLHIYTLQVAQLTLASHTKVTWFKIIGVLTLRVFTLVVSFAWFFWSKKESITFSLGSLKNRKQKDTVKIWMDLANLQNIQKCVKHIVVFLPAWNSQRY